MRRAAKRTASQGSVRELHMCVNCTDTVRIKIIKRIPSVEKIIFLSFGLAAVQDYYIEYYTRYTVRYFESQLLLHCNAVA